jgi:hypothetical protein
MRSVNARPVEGAVGVNPGERNALVVALARLLGAG